MRYLCSLLLVALVGVIAAAQTTPERVSMRVVTAGLLGPWEVTWGPDRHLWVTERTGKRVVRVNPETGAQTVAATIGDVHQSVGQDGLLGLALHPDLLRDRGNDFVYVAFTYDADPGPALARRLGIRRYRYDPQKTTLVEPADLLRDLPSHDDHVGGRLVIGPDRRLYLAIGDGGANFGGNRCLPNRSLDLPTAADVTARNWTSYWGKILRLDLDGGVPADNPTINGVRSHVFSYGHRNPLGLAFGANGALYESEHGPSSDDEVNLIQSGRNYGWPRIAGYRDDRAYVYANWSASTIPCVDLPPRGPLPAAVPTAAESTYADPQFTPPLQTFFTVDQLPTTGTATIAPGGLDVYSVDGIRGWKPSVLALSLIRGVVYRLPLSADGRSLSGQPIEIFRSVNRYRDIAIHPDGRAFYVVTDPSGAYRDPSGTTTQALAHPGAVLEFTVTAAP